MLGGISVPRTLAHGRSLCRAESSQPHESDTALPATCAIAPRRLPVSLKVCVFGLWHLGCVTAAASAQQGLDVIGLDFDADRVNGLKAGVAPIFEPDLNEVIRAELDRGRLRFTTDPSVACAHADVLWATFDTPVDDSDQADVGWLNTQLDRVRRYVQPGTLIVISSQVPVGFTRALATRWTATDPTIEFATAPENLRLGEALQVFREPDRVVIGNDPQTDRARIRALFGSASSRIEWMSIESAEMTKHALNGFLASSVAYTNEVARICELVGADASEVERGLRTERRIGPRAYVKPGAPIAGGTLARDVNFLQRTAAEHGVSTPFLEGLLRSNALHARWLQDHVADFLQGVGQPRVALLGLTYKVGTDTLRRSPGIELARWLLSRNVDVIAYDPVVRELPADQSALQIADTLEHALQGADLAVVATPWPEFQAITADQLNRAMRRAQIIDQNGFLNHLSDDERVRYVRVGWRSTRSRVVQ